MSKKIDYLVGWLKAKQSNLNYIDPEEGDLYCDAFIDDFREYAEKILNITE